MGVICLAIYGIYCYFALWFDEETIILNYYRPSSHELSSQGERDVKCLAVSLYLIFVCLETVRHITPLSPLERGWG